MIDNSTLELIVIPGERSYLSNLTFNWTAIKFEKQFLILELDFDNALYVSVNEVIIKIYFLGKRLFIHKIHR